jgi:hypothetical protein
MKSVLRGMQNTATFVSETQDTEGDATTIRPSATAVLAIDSDDRYSNYRQRRNFPTYPFSFNIQKNENILSGFFKRIALTEFRLNWTLPNISVAWGNTALILHYKIGTDNDSETTVILPDGFYNAQELALELQNQIRVVIPGFQVVISDRDDDTMTFNPPANYTIFIESLNKPTRELVDMLNVPTQTFLYLKTISGGSQTGNQVLYTVPNGTEGFKIGMAVQVVGITGGTGWNVSSYLTPVIVVAIPSPNTVLLQYQTTPTGTPTNFTTGRIDNMYYPVIQSGIPNLRPMDFFDLVCNQLSYNQDLKDSTSAPLTRDMISRIYLDDSVGSQSIFNTNIYSNTANTHSITGISANNLDEVIFNVSDIRQYTAGSQAVIGGLVGATSPPAVPLTNWNTTVEIINVVAGVGNTGTISVIYPVVPGGVPTVFTDATITSYAQTSFSTPQTTWDDRVNGVSPFVIYRQFPYPKQIRWSNKMPIGNLTFELYDDQGRNIQDLWNSAYPPATPEGLAYANSFVWNATMLVSED